MKKLIITFLVCGFATLCQAQTAAEAKVWQRVEALTNAIFVKRDSAALLDLVSARVTYGHSAGAIEDKPVMVHKAMVSKTTYRNQQFEKVSIDVQDRVAVVRHNFRAISIDETGKESPLDLGILQVWRKEGNTWRIIARQAVRIAPKS
jgi:ketosteroid isomerase-like protein